jgi:hypothetical protein
MIYNYSARFPGPVHLSQSHNETHLCGNGDLNLDTGLDVDNDLLDDLGRGLEAIGTGS